MLSACKRSDIKVGSVLYNRLFRSFIKVSKIDDKYFYYSEGGVNFYHSLNDLDLFYVHRDYEQLRLF